MATKYTTRTATMRQSQVVDQRKIAVGKKVEIGGKYGTVVSDDKVVTKELFVDYNGESTNILDLIASGGGGETPVVDGRIAVSDGSTTWNNVKKIIFDGATITKGDEEGSIIITIVGGGQPIVVPELTTMSITGLETESMYLFSGAGDYTLPSNYKPFEKSYNRTTYTPVIKLSGNGGGAFGFENLTTKLRLTFTNSNGTTIKTYESAVLNADATGTIGNWTYGEATVKSGKITFEEITFTVPNADLLGSWKVKVSVIQDDKEPKDISESEEYFAYITNPNTPTYIGDKFEITMREALPARNTNYTHISGIPYESTTKQYVGFAVKTIPFNNSVYMAAADLVRGTLTVSRGDISNTKYIKGSSEDTKDTEVTNTIEIGFADIDITESGEYEVVITQTITDGTEGTKTETRKIGTATEGDDRMVDTYNTAYFESEGGDYGRVLGYINDNEEIVISPTIYAGSEKVVGNENEEIVTATVGYNGSEQIALKDFYNKQAVVKNGSLIHPSKAQYESYNGDTTTPKYYIRKFIVNNEDDTEMFDFKIRIPSLTELGTGEDDDVEVRMYYKHDDSELFSYCRVDMDSALPGGMADSSKLAYDGTIIDGTIYAVINASIQPDIRYNSEFYIVIKLNNIDSKVDGDITVTKAY